MAKSRFVILLERIGQFTMARGGFDNRSHPKHRVPETFCNALSNRISAKESTQEDVNLLL
jgi:hypothetical protein